MPIIYITEMLTQRPILYTGPLKENAIRSWAQSLLKGGVETTVSEYNSDPNLHNILPVLYEELEATLESAGFQILRDRTEIDDLLSF